MDIFVESGDKVKVTERSKNNGWDKDKDLVKKYLKIDEPYTVDYVNVHPYHTHVFLKEIPNIAFNSENFEDVEDVEDIDND
jgi:hypothetical protein